MSVLIHNVSKRYEQFKDNQALVNVSLTIESHEHITAIIGPSGSGKSTLLNLIGALDKPNTGEIIVNSLNLSKLSRYN